MPQVIGIGTPYVDYFFDFNKVLLKKYQLKSEEDIEFKDKQINPRQFFTTHKPIAKSAGGISTNTIAVLSKLGIKTAYAGVIGKDLDGDFWKKQLKKIDTSHVISKGKTSVCACILTNKREKRTFLYTVNKSDNDFFKNVDYTFLNSANIIHVSPFLLGMDNTISKLENVLKKLSKSKISFAPNSVYVSLELNKLRPILKYIDILFVNEDEVEILTSESVKKGSKSLLEFGPSIIVSTMGAKGALVTTKDQHIFAKGKKVKKVIDTTGAGDAFAAGFLYGILKKKSLQWSLNFANKIASQSVTDFGLHWLSRLTV